MPLKIYNSLTHRKEEFQPVRPGKVGIYFCGITAYDECHLGHARAAVVADVILRTLVSRGYDVTFVRNFTDIDDKIIQRARETGKDWQEIAETYIRSYTDLMNRLQCLRPTVEPRATAHLQEMIDLAAALEKKGVAYQAGGDLVYSVRSFPGYGKLSHKKIDDLAAGARVEVDEKKRDPLDFVLWKAAKPDEPQWSSPWGPGRPGWHLECSAMSMKYLGDSFDIHGGGRDLIFPHHENEIAQSEAVTSRPLARFWIHNGFVNINAEKMSKSLGNIRTIRAILDQWSAEAVRFFLISNHYRSPLDFTDESLTEAEEALGRFYETIRRLKSLPEGGAELPDAHWIPTFEKAMDDDFNTAAFLGTLFDRIRRLNSWIDRHPAVDAASRDRFLEDLAQVHRVLGVFGTDPVAFFQKRKKARLVGSHLSPDEIEGMIQMRLEARRARDWRRADEIRRKLADQGIELRDNPDGTTTWEVR